MNLLNSFFLLLSSSEATTPDARPQSQATGSNDQLWVDRYKPKKFVDLLGDEVGDFIVFPFYGF